MSKITFSEKLIMKTLILLISALVSLSILANEKSQLIDQEGLFFIKNGKHEIPIFQNDARFDLVENGQLLQLRMNQTGEIYTLGSLETKEVEVSVIVHEVKKKFKATTCSHIGCFPNPHIETSYKSLVEIKTLEGQIICYNNKVNNRLQLWSVGVCLK